MLTHHPPRTEWERDPQRDCQSSLSSGEVSYPAEGPEDGYSYHHEPPRKPNGRYLSADALVSTQPAFSLAPVRLFTIE